jgi:hypothetical protein
MTFIKKNIESIKKFLYYLENNTLYLYFWLCRIALEKRLKKPICPHITLFPSVNRLDLGSTLAALIFCSSIDHFIPIKRIKVTEWILAETSQDCNAIIESQTFYSSRHSEIICENQSEFVIFLWKAYWNITKIIHKLFLRGILKIQWKLYCINESLRLDYYRRLICHIFW